MKYALSPKHTYVLAEIGHKRVCAGT